MLKPIGLLTALVLAIATAAYLPAGDKDSASKGLPDAKACGACCSTTETSQAKTCTAGECCAEKCSKCTAGEECCEGCPSTKLTSKGEGCEGCPSTKQTSKGEGCCGSCPSTKLTSTGEGCESCPSTKQTSKGEGCEGCPSTKQTSKGEGCCESCPSTKLTSAGEGCESCPSTKLTSKGEGCEGCPSTKQTSKGEGCCESCPSTKLTSTGEGCQSCPATKATSAACTGKCADCDGSCSKDTTVATSANSAEGCSASCGANCTNCPITAAMAKLPQMTYQVGDEKLCCPNAAGELAKKSGNAIQYVVADKTYEKEAAAKLALAEATEKFVAAFAEPKEESGTITVAGHEACCAGTAAQMAQQAKSAMEKVQMTYLVGEKSCNCPIEAEKLASDSGDVKLFVVGEEKTACNVTARLNLARAKYKAAVVALMQTSSDTSDTKPTSSDTKVTTSDS